MNIIILALSVVILRAGSVYNDEAVFHCKDDDENKLHELALFPIDCWVFVLICIGWIEQLKPLLRLCNLQE